MTHDSIQRETLIDAPVDRVWSLLTEAEHLGTWFADSGAEIDPRPGGAVTLRWAKHGTVAGVVEAIEPQRRFAVRWALFDADAVRDDNSTLVEFTLTPEGGGTKVHVVESGFAGLAGSEAEQRRHAEQNTEGWKHELGHLAQYAAEGRVAA